ncbi:hypothetical protein ACHHYP_00763 [Achlya hypogyna]|uniref:Uncharacterized protein n=1 Tax=Achlya hypogyna TaxID=1202772 RepID=A0A1V9ZTZ3_ACHHY|nr:hypothetical protein ACHHYP_00763 [Achlya hypogyna]
MEQNLAAAPTEQPAMNNAVSDDISQDLDGTEFCSDNSLIVNLSDLGEEVDTEATRAMGTAWDALADSNASEKEALEEANALTTAPTAAPVDVKRPPSEDLALAAPAKRLKPIDISTGAERPSWFTQPLPAEPIVKLDPALVKLDPALVKPEPAAVKPEPAAFKPVPIAAKPVPIAAKPVPIAAKPEPGVIKPAPVVVKPDVSPATSVKPCWLCGKNDGVILPCLGCLIAVHAACIDGQKLCGSCRIMWASPPFQPVATSDPTTLAMVRGIEYIHSIMAKPELFALVGHVSVLHLFELAVHAPPAVRPMLDYYMPQFAQRLIAEKLVDVVTKKLSPKDLINAIVVLYSLKRANISNALVEAVAVQVAQHSVVDLLGWDPRKELPTVRYSNLCGGCGKRNERRLVKCKCGRLCNFPSMYEGYRSTFVIVYHAEQVGIPIGCSVVDVIQHWPVLRQHYITNPASAQENTLYGEQLKMICSLLDLLSDHRTRLFDAPPFALEHKLLFNADMLRKWMASNMYDQVGTALHCMQLFTDVAPDHAAMVASCRAFVFAHQQPNGSWGFVNETHQYVDILRYKATHSCVKALMAPIVAGFGPSHVDVYAYVQQWTPTPQRTPAGIAVGNRAFDNLRKLYHGHFALEKEETNNAFRAAVQQHLSNLLQQPDKDEVSHVPAGYRRYSRDVWDRDTVLESYNVLTMADLSIFDGLKFEDGEVLVAGDAAADDDLLINDDDDEDDVVVVEDYDDEETKNEWQ